MECKSVFAGHWMHQSLQCNISPSFLWQNHCGPHLQNHLLHPSLKYFETKMVLYGCILRPTGIILYAKVNAMVLPVADNRTSSPPG